MRHLEVTLAKPDSPESQTKMHFKLLDLEIINRLDALMVDANRDKALIRTSWGMYADSSKQAQLCDALDNHILAFNGRTSDDINISYRIDGNPTPTILNKIHDRFDFYYHQFLDRSPNNSKNDDDSSESNLDEIFNGLHSINAHVHMLESISEVDHYLEEDLVCAWHTFCFFKGPRGDHYRQPMEEADLDLFTMEESFGSVYLGYGRAGKSLYDIFESDDVAVLQSGYVARPATSVAAAFVFLFGNYHKSHEHQLERFHDWWDKNDVGQYGYKKYDKYNTLGRIKLGSLAPNKFIQHLYDTGSGCFDEVGVIKFYSDYSNVVGAELIDVEPTDLIGL